MVLELKIRLDGSRKPPIWRKIKIDQATFFHELHVVIQAAFGWENRYLYQFSQKGWGSGAYIQEDLNDRDHYEEPFSDISTWLDGDKYDSEKIKLSDYFHTIGQKMIYIYDFGDDWRHVIELLSISDEPLPHPTCIGGKGQCPPEDCGGIWVYYDLVAKVNNLKDSDSKSLRKAESNPGRSLNLNEFNLEETNARIRKYWEK